MKTETKKKIGIGALIVAVVATVVAVTKAKAAPPKEYLLSDGEWEAPMPFEVYSEHDFSMNFKNISDRRYDYDLRMELYPGGGYSRWGGSIGPGNSVGMSTNWYMPPAPGTYDMTLEIYVDGVFMEEVVASRVEVVWKTATKKKVGIGALIATGIAVTAKLIHKARAEEERPEPPEPPPEGTGRVQGYVIDATTDQAVSRAQIYADGEPNATADTTGGFRTSYVDYGPHILTIYGDGYETAHFEIMLEQSLYEDVFYLEPLEEIPGFPDDIAVTGIVVQPETIRLGETVAILVHLLGPYPDVYPRTVTGTISVDGEQLTETIEMRFRNPAMSFQYTPPTAGTYKVLAKDKSATFEVLEDVVGTFYCPFGCVNPETEHGTWESKLSLLGDWPVARLREWSCMAPPHFYGGGTGATGYMGSVYCPFCYEPLHTGRIPGDNSYLWRLAEMLFDHIERAHPEVQWDKPPAWLQWIETGFDTFCIHGHCDYDIFVDGVKVWHYPSVSRRIAAPSFVLAPGEHTVKVEGLALSGGYPYEWVTFEHSIVVDNDGDRLTLNVETGETTLVTWESLLG